MIRSQAGRPPLAHEQAPLTPHPQGAPRPLMNLQLERERARGCAVMLRSFEAH